MIGAARVAVLLLDLFQFLDDDVAQLLLASQDGFVLGDAPAHLGQFLQDFVDGKPGQAVQLQFQDGVGLHGVERLRQGLANALQRRRLAGLPSATLIVLPVKYSTRLVRASARFSLPRMMRMTSSTRSSAAW